MIKMGASGYLLKSCDPEDIKHALITIYNDDYYYSNTATSRLFSRIKKGKIKLPHFTDHEIDFLKFCPTDLSYGEIAGKLELTTKSIEGYRDRLFNKLRVNSRTGLAIYAIQFGLFQVETKLKPDNVLFSNKKKARI